MSFKLTSKVITAALLTMLLGACSHLTKDAVSDASPIQADAAKSEQNDLFAGWRHYPLPGKTATLYSLDRLDGRRFDGESWHLC